MSTTITNDYLQQLFTDIEISAELAQVPFDKQCVQKVLQQFGSHFATAPVEFRTTNKPDGKRALAFRYVDLQTPHDPFQMAVDGGLLQSTGAETEQLLRTLQTEFSILGWGVDATTHTGLEKIWVFLDYKYPIEHAYAIESAPAGFVRADAYHKRFGLNQFTICGLDFHNRSTNLYFPFPQALQGETVFSRQEIADMIVGIGGELPDTTVIEQLRYTPIVNLTYTWDSDEIARLCFYYPTINPVTTDESDPLIKTYIDDAPIRANHRAFIMGHAFGPKGSYRKVENDYDGQMLDMFAQAVSVPMWQPVDEQAAITIELL